MSPSAVCIISRSLAVSAPVPSTPLATSSATAPICGFNDASSAAATADSTVFARVVCAAVAEEVARGVEGTGAETASGLDMMHTAEGDIDPVVEADVYLAYRRYQQAETLIQAALAKQPRRRGRGGGRRGGGDAARN